MTQGQEKAIPSNTSSPKEQRRLHQQEVSRAQILDAAEQVFAIRGYYEASLQEIAERAEFSVGALYRFFDSKETIFNAVILRGFEGYLRGALPLAAADLSVSERLSNLRDFLITYMREHRYYAQLYLRTPLFLPQTEPQLDERVRERISEARAMTAQLYREGHRTGEIVEGEPDMLVLFADALIRAYLVTDPAIWDRPGTPGFPSSLFRAFMERAFRVQHQEERTDHNG